MKHRSLNRLLLLVLLALTSCGKIQTIVSVFPDGSARLTYAVEAPVMTGDPMGQLARGNVRGMFSDTKSAPDTKGLMDTLLYQLLEPYLAQQHAQGRIRDYHIADTTSDFSNRKATIDIDLSSFRDVGPMHARLRRELPSVDSLFVTFTKQAAMRDSFAIVDLGDSLEFQLYDIYARPGNTSSRTDNIARARAFIDSIASLVKDTSAPPGDGMSDDRYYLSSLMGEEGVISDDKLDSLGQALSLLESMSVALVTPKFTLYAPVLLSDNSEEFNSLSRDEEYGGISFSAGGMLSPGETMPGPVRQRFSLTLPARSGPRVRDEWRSLLGWCEQCEEGFNQAQRRTGQGIEFFSVGTGSTLISVDCGSFDRLPARAYYFLNERSRMPEYFGFEFKQTFYIPDVTYEIMNGSPNIQMRRSNMIIGEQKFDPKTRKLTITRPEVQETFELHELDAIWRSGRYKDRAGKWQSLSAASRSSSFNEAPAALCGQPRTRRNADAIKARLEQMMWMETSE